MFKQFQLSIFFLLFSTSLMGQSSQDNQYEVSNYLEDPSGNAYITVSKGYSERHFIRRAGSNELVPVKEASYNNRISLADSLNGENFSAENTTYHGPEDSCVAVQNEQGQTQFFKVPSGSQEVDAQNEPATFPFIQRDESNNSRSSFQASINSGQINIPELPENRATRYLLRNPDSGKIIYIDRNVNSGWNSEYSTYRFFEGTPGNMKEVEVSRFIQMRGSGDTTQLSDGRSLYNRRGSGLRFGRPVEETTEERRARVRNREAAPLEAEENLERVDLESFDLASLGIEGVPQETIEYESPCILQGLGTITSILDESSDSNAIADSGRNFGEETPNNSGAVANSRNQPSSRAE
ncbi:MAG: hypothetical protein CME62_15535 [Halobacteriovoraceae bacterium]|nr:hypothetical protein [Halobacteriovoraceae bacterium]|tara:strand:+ start:13738 stop:14793 length:1056 start_codon:yes stop_codon:yes gene_type:complete